MNAIMLFPGRFRDNGIIGVEEGYDAFMSFDHSISLANTEDKEFISILVALVLLIVFIFIE